MGLDTHRDDDVVFESGLPAGKELVGRPDDLTLAECIVVRLWPLIGKAIKLLRINPGKTLGLQVFHQKAPRGCRHISRIAPPVIGHQEIWTTESRHMLKV